MNFINACRVVCYVVIAFMGLLLAGCNNSRMAVDHSSAIGLLKSVQKAQQAMDADAMIECMLPEYRHCYAAVKCNVALVRTYVNMKEEVRCRRGENEVDKMHGMDEQILNIFHVYNRVPDSAWGQVTLQRENQNPNDQDSKDIVYKAYYEKDLIDFVTQRHGRWYLYKPLSKEAVEMFDDRLEGMVNEYTEDIAKLEQVRKQIADGTMGKEIFEEWHKKEYP